MFNFSAYVCLSNSSISVNKFVDFLPVDIVSCGDRPFRPQLVVHVHISATIPRVSHAVTHSTYVHSIFTIES